MKRIPATILACGTLLAAGPPSPGGPLPGQDLAGAEALDFRVQLENHPPPNDTRLKSLLEGARAQNLSNGLILLTEARLRTFDTNGSPQVTVETPGCVFDTVHHVVSSQGLLRVKTADGNFFTEGEGFSMQITNSTLILSNRVHTIVKMPPRRSFKP